MFKRILYALVIQFCPAINRCFFSLQQNSSDIFADAGPPASGRAGTHLQHSPHHVGRKRSNESGHVTLCIAPQLLARRFLFFCRVYTRLITCISNRWSFCPYCSAFGAWSWRWTSLRTSWPITHCLLSLSSCRWSCFSPNCRDWLCEYWSSSTSFRAIRPSRRSFTQTVSKSLLL